MSASPQPERLADVLRQLVALGSDAPGDERPATAGKGEGNEPEGMGSGCEKIESKEHMSRISPLMSFTAGCPRLDGEPQSQ